jgi:DNA-binding NarL/FixJ family response regulator
MNRPLSPRQIEAMRMLSEGLLVKQIADRLGIAMGTTKIHLKDAYTRLGARNKTEAVAIAIRSNLI